MMPTTLCSRRKKSSQRKIQHRPKKTRYEIRDQRRLTPFFIQHCHTGCRGLVIIVVLEKIVEQPSGRALLLKNSWLPVIGVDLECCVSLASRLQGLFQVLRARRREVCVWSKATLYPIIDTDSNYLQF